MARWIALSAAVALAVAVPAQGYVVPADNCADPVTYQTPDDVAYSPAQPQAGQAITYSAGGDPAYIRPGSLVFTVTDPSGATTQLRPADPNGQSVTFTPRDPGPYNVEASWQGKNCNNPESYGAGSAGPTNHQVAAKPEPTQTTTPGARTCPPGQVVHDDGKCGPPLEPLSQAVKTKAVPGFVRKWGIEAPHVLPANCRSASVWHHRNLNVSPPGKPNPSGVWIGYGPNTSKVSCPQVLRSRSRSR